MRVATFNLLHGRSPADGRVDAARLAGAVRALDADVLALQEVDRDQPRSGHLDLAAVAAEAMGAVAWRFVPALVGAPGAWQAHDGVPAYGIALLSRHPVSAWRVLRLPALPVRAPLRFRQGRPVLVRDEPRVAVVATVEAPGGPLAVASTHLSYAPGWGAWQLRLVSRELRAHPRAVLAGDLNLGPAVARLVSGMAPLAAGPTFPAHRPRRQIDHLLGRGVRVSTSGTHALPLSDHRALTADLLP